MPLIWLSSLNMKQMKCFILPTLGMPAGLDLDKRQIRRLFCFYMKQIRCLFIAGLVRIRTSDGD